MAIYKLGNIFNYVEGYTTPPINNEKFFGGNKINWMRVKDLKHGSKIIGTELNLSKKGFNLIKNKNQQIFLKNSIVWSKDGTIGNVGILKINVCARGIFNILPKKNVYNQYLYYILLKNRNKFQRLATGAVIKHFSGSNFMNFQINLPNKKIQKQIIDIIEPLEKILFNIKQQINLFEKFINKIRIEKTNKTNIFSKIQTGKLNVSASLKNGKYPFFTCGKKVMRTNSNSFNGRYILLSGNGEIYNWWFDGEFDLYQRVYALKEKDNFFTTYFSLIKGINKLRKRSNGAVIKFIKINDIKSINLYKYSHEKILEIIFKIMNKNDKIVYKINELLNYLLKLLIK